MQRLTELPPPLAEDKHCTWADILAAEEEVRAELIDGHPTLITSLPPVHQECSGGLFVQLANYMQGKKGVVIPLIAMRPFEKKGDRPKDVDTVLYPDVMVLCNRDKLDEYGCIGAPDMVVEVLSPSSVRHDRFTKFNLYQRAGVREYWIVDPDSKLVQVFLLEDGQYNARIYDEKDAVKVNILEDCVIDLSLVFPE